MDFTIGKYKQLLEALKNADYTFQPFAEFLEAPIERAIILRHDVDAKKQNSLRFAKIQAVAGIKATYYFRIVQQSFGTDVIKEIASLGHEIGYHYEELSTYQGDFNKAFQVFQMNLDKLRKLAPVSTICMHGSPRSKYDSRDLWKTHDYKELQIIGEPYFDVDFSKVLYFTDTGRRWDGQKVSIRDKVDNTQYQELKQNGYIIHSTDDLIKAAKAKALTDAIMLTIHPQRWHSSPILWTSELIAQNLKNVAKRVLLGLNR